ncbi:MAG: hypothetical protein K0S65_3869 [Labilithrix sp.]|nr:hypothetical protein [Labilithrix sp.]
METCAGVSIPLSAPAVAEVAVVGSVGAARDESRWSVAGGGGAEITFGGRLWNGFPSGDYGRANSAAELRAGPWASITTRAHGVIFEAGPKVHLGAVYHASWGTFDLRPAIGTGEFAAGHSALTSLTVAYGVRSEPRRYYDQDACVEGKRLVFMGPPKKPALFALASVYRVFGTYRRAIELPAWEVVLGIEVSPDWVLPPYSWSRLIGFPPQ